MDTDSARPRDVSDFLTGLATADGASAATSTIQRKAAALRSFYRHLRRVPINPCLRASRTGAVSLPCKIIDFVCSG